jgi:hypothetical protein
MPAKPMTGLAMLMRGPKKMSDGGEAHSEPDGDEGMSGAHHAMRDFISAVHAKDHMGAHQALLDWHSMKEDSMDAGDMADPMENEK